MPGDRPETPVSTHYHLRGIVVHSGQASGGHYYSFIRVRYGVRGGLCVNTESVFSPDLRVPVHQNGSDLTMERSWRPR